MILEINGGRGENRTPIRSVENYCIVHYTTRPLAEDDSIELLPIHHQYYGFQDRLRSQPQHLPSN